jgi:hypothetical protein
MTFAVYGSGDQVPDARLVDGVVHKSAGPWTPSVRALLRHLEAQGFAGAPRVAGDGFTYVPGESPHPRAWPADTVGQVGELLRGLHDAAATFRPAPDAVWQPHWLRDLPGDDLVFGHGDTGPWNIVGTPPALIDWEYAGPVDRLWELAQAVWLNAHLVDDDVAAMHQHPDATTRARHARAIADGYGLSAARRAELADRLCQVAVHAARAEARSDHPDGYPVLWGLTWRARSAGWILENETLIRRALTA